MWRFIDGASEPKKKKLSDDDKKKYYTEYDKTKRSRTFILQWANERPWLKNTDDGMKCTYCLKHEVKRQSLFVQGAKSYKLETVKIHEQSQSHMRCQAIAEAKSSPVILSPAANLVRKLNDENFKKMEILFRTSHALAINNRPFSDFTWMCELDSVKGLHIGETYRNIQAAKTFVSYIAKSELNKVSSHINSSKFICIIGDGSTDASVKEQEMWFVRSCKEGTIRTDFIGIDSCEKASAENIVHGVQNIVDQNLNNIEWTPFCQKMVAISCDGASVMVGSKGGVGALLRKQQPALITIHCMAHRLELSLKDAAKSVKLYDKTVNVLAMGLYYFYHNSSLNRAMLNRSSKALRSDGDKGLLLPTRVGGTRWIGHTALALEHMTVSYKYITGHLGQLTEPVERVSVASRAKAHAFLKLLRMKSVVYFIYFLMDVLIPLKRLSLGVQDRTCLISRQHSTLESVVEVLRGYKTSDGPNLRRILDCQTELKGDDREFIAARSTLLGQIEAALLRRFAEFSSLGVVKATRIADLQSWPKSWEILKEFGTEDLLKLIDHFSTLLDEAGLKRDEIEMEWTMLKKDISDNEFKYDSWKAVNDVYGSQYRNILDVMDLIMTMSPSSAEAERGFSMMKLVKTKIRSNLSQGSLNDLLVTKLHAPNVEKFNPSDAIYLWNSDGARTRRMNFKDKSVKNSAEFTFNLEVPTEKAPTVVDLVFTVPEDSSLSRPSSDLDVIVTVVPEETESSQSQPQPIAEQYAAEAQIEYKNDSATHLIFKEASTQTIEYVQQYSKTTKILSKDGCPEKYYSSDDETYNDSDVDSDLEEGVVFSKLKEYVRN